MLAELFESEPVSLGQGVRKLREKRRVSKDELAKTANVMLIAVTYLEEGEFEKVTVAEAHQIIHNLDLPSSGETIQILRQLVNSIRVWKAPDVPITFASRQLLAR